MPIDHITCDAIDRVINIEMRFRAGMPRGVNYPLYAAARERQKEPLTLAAARLLLERVTPGRHVLVVSGAGVEPGLPKGETDGPPGAASIVRALEYGLGAKPILVCEERLLGPLIASTEAAGVAVVREELFNVRKSVALALDFPIGIEEGRQASREILDKYDPAAIVFVEKIGPNERGMCHSVTGTPRPLDQVASVYHLAQMARERGIATIGVGDGGNEIGCGNIQEAVRSIQPYGRDCGCPCGGGMATAIEPDVLVFAAVSNWGAYGIVAALAGLLEQPDLLQDEATELRMLHRCVDSGAMDGCYSRQIPYVDGTSDRVQASLITMLHQIVRHGLTEYDRGFDTQRNRSPKP